MADGNNLVLVERKRFATVDEDEIQRILEEKDSVNTRRATDSAVRTLQAYLREKGLSENFEDLSKTDLNMVLSKFYTEARQENGQMYKKSSMFALRHGLNRYLSCKPIDLIHDPEFKESNKTFAAIIKELKRQGLGGVEHHPPVEEEDLRKVYSYFDLNDNVKLQEKVFVDVLLYFGRRGRENLYELKSTHLSATTDAEGLVYVYIKNDELTKNHQEDTNTADGRMYSLPDDDMCPVKSFMKYKEHLNSKCDRLFQRPNKKFSPNCARWYDNAPLGHNSLGEMMPNISQKAGLSRRYTNHSLHATSVHLLDSIGKYASRHIMTVTGHKSETSLKTYTGYTDSKIKRSMSDTISGSLRIYGTCSSEEAMYCAALNCSVKARQGYSLYRFPEKDERRRKIWIQNLGRGDYYEPPTLARICVKHFDGNQFIVDPRVAASIGFEPKKLTLREDAIPTVFDHTDYSEIKERKDTPSRKRTRQKLKRKLSPKIRPNILRKECDSDSEETESASSTDSDEHELYEPTTRVLRNLQGEPMTRRISSRQKTVKKVICFLRKDDAIVKTAFAGNKNLFGSGLGEKLIDFPQHGTEAEVRATILRAFPKLKEADKFEILEKCGRKLVCVPNIKGSFLTNITNSRLYVRPIELDKDTDKVMSDSGSEQKYDKTDLVSGMEIESDESNVMDVDTSSAGLNLVNPHSLSNTSHHNIVNPHSLSNTAHLNIVNPHSLSNTSHLNIVNPHSLSNTSHHNIVNPHSLSNTSHHNIVNPHSLSNSANHNIINSLSQSNTANHNIANPHSQSNTEHHNIVNPHSLSNTSHHNIVNPHSLSNTEHHNIVNPHSLSNTSHHNIVNPHSLSNTSHHNIVNPHSLSNSANHNIANPHSQSNTEHHNIANPHSQSNTAHLNIVDPLSQSNTTHHNIVHPPSQSNRTSDNSTIHNSITPQSQTRTASQNLVNPQLQAKTASQNLFNPQLQAKTASQNLFNSRSQMNAASPNSVDQQSQETTETKNKQIYYEGADIRKEKIRLRLESKQHDGFMLNVSKKPGLLQAFSRNLYFIQQQGFLCDLRLQGKDGSVYAHRLVLLASGSPLFQSTLLDFNTWNSSRISLDFECYSCNVIDALIRYIYTGEIKIEKNNAEEFCKLCDWLQFSAVSKIIRPFCVENVLSPICNIRLQNKTNKDFKPPENKVNAGSVIKRDVEMIQQEEETTDRFSESRRSLSEKLRDIMKKNQQLMLDIAMQKENDRRKKLLGGKSLKPQEGRKTNENSGTGEYQPEDEFMSEKVNETVLLQKNSADDEHATQAKSIGRELSTKSQHSKFNMYIQNTENENVSDVCRLGTNDGNTPCYFMTSNGIPNDSAFLNSDCNIISDFTVEHEGGNCKLHFTKLKSAENVSNFAVKTEPECDYVTNGLGIQSESATSLNSDSSTEYNIYTAINTQNDDLTQSKSYLSSNDVMISNVMIKREPQWDYHEYKDHATESLLLTTESFEGFGDMSIKKEPLT